MYYRYYFGDDDDYCGLCLYSMVMTMLLGLNDGDDENALRTKRLRYEVVVPLVDCDYDDDDLGVIVNCCGDDDDGVRPFSF